MTFNGLSWKVVEIVHTIIIQLVWSRSLHEKFLFISITRRFLPPLTGVVGETGTGLRRPFPPAPPTSSPISAIAQG